MMALCYLYDLLLEIVPLKMKWDPVLKQVFIRYLASSISSSKKEKQNIIFKATKLYFVLVVLFNFKKIESLLSYQEIFLSLLKFMWW